MPRTAKKSTSDAFSKFRVSKQIHNEKEAHKRVKAHSKQLSQPVTQSDSQDIDITSDVAPILGHSSSSHSTLEEAIPEPIRPSLNEKDPTYINLSKHIHAQRWTPQIHTTTGTIDTILRDFDLTGAYGPCVGITRLERFNRAKSMGMKPDPIIGEILASQEAHTQTNLRNDLFYGRL